MNVTRRKLAGMLAGAAPLLAQTPPFRQTPDEQLKAASERLRNRTAAIAKFRVPTAT